MSEVNDAIRHQLGLGPSPVEGSDDAEARHQAAADAGLPDEVAEHLGGRTPQEIAADAIAFAEGVREREAEEQRAALNTEIRRQAQR